MKDHKIGRSPYFHETKSGDFSRELFKALPKTIGILILSHAYGSPSALFTFYFGTASQSDVVKPGDDNDIEGSTTFMPHGVRLCYTEVPIRIAVNMD